MRLASPISGAAVLNCSSGNWPGWKKATSTKSNCEPHHTAPAAGGRRGGLARHLRTTALSCMNSQRHIKWATACRVAEMHTRSQPVSCAVKRTNGDKDCSVAQLALSLPSQICMWIKGGSKELSPRKRKPRRSGGDSPARCSSERLFIAKPILLPQVEVAASCLIPSRDWYGFRSPTIWNRSHVEQSNGRRLELNPEGLLADRKEGFGSVSALGYLLTRTEKTNQPTPFLVCHVARPNHNMVVVIHVS